MGKVVELDAVYYGEVPVDQVLDGAKGLGLEAVQVVGFDTNGHLVTLSSTADTAQMLLMLELAKARVIDHACAADEAERYSDGMPASVLRFVTPSVEGEGST